MSADAIDPIIYVDSDRIAVRGRSVLASWTLFSGFLVALAALVSVLPIIIEWQDLRDDALVELEGTLSTLGEQYVLNVLATTETSLYQYIYPDRRFTLVEFITYAWSDNSLVLHVFGFVALAVLLFLTACTLLFVGLRRRLTPALWFDRDLGGIYQGVGHNLKAVMWEEAQLAIARFGPIWTLKDEGGTVHKVTVVLTQSPRFGPTPGQIQEHLDQITSFMSGGGLAHKNDGQTPQRASRADVERLILRSAT